MAAAAIRKKKPSYEYCPWQSKLLDIHQRFGYLLEKEKFADCSLILGRQKQVINCHKLILASVSPRFETAFYEEGVDTLEYEDINADAFRYALQHIYLQKEEKTPFPYELSAKMFYIAMKFKIEIFRLALIRILSSAPWPADCVLLIYNAVNLYNEGLMVALAMDHIRNYKLQLLTHPSLFRQDHGTFKNIIRIFQRQVSEIHIFYAVERYCSEFRLLEDVSGEQTPEPELNLVVKTDETSPHTSYILNLSGPEVININNLENRQATAKELTDLINFHAMTPSEFANGPANSKLLSAEERFALLINICNAHDCKKEVGPSRDSSSSSN